MLRTAYDNSLVDSAPPSGSLAPGDVRFRGCLISPAEGQITGEQEFGQREAAHIHSHPGHLVQHARGQGADELVETIASRPAYCGSAKIRATS